MPGLLAHVCCAPDALYVLQQLKQTYRPGPGEIPGSSPSVTGYFYNPNIYPSREYDLRLAEAEKVASLLGLTLLQGPRDFDRWTALTRKFKDEPEKGRRCDVCYALRLKETACAASRLGFEAFTTIMSLSPWKKADVLNRLGRMFGRRYGLVFVEANFKKKDGFRRSILLSKEHGLYRQDYCGCVYSLKPKAAGPQSHG
jgi:predicted adenine nucleotide alpha hydrolase (AANH) superfamily ATPase